MLELGITVACKYVSFIIQYVVQWRRRSDLKHQQL